MGAGAAGIAAGIGLDNKGAAAGKAAAGEEIRGDEMAGEAAAKGAAAEPKE